MDNEYDLFEEEWFLLWDQLKKRYFNLSGFDERNGPERPMDGENRLRERFLAERFGRKPTKAELQNWDAFRALLQGERFSLKRFKPSEWGVIFRQLTDGIKWLRLPDDEHAMNPIRSGGLWNVYPSDLSGPCRPKGVFFAVDAPGFGMKKGRETLDLETALHAMVQRAQGRCADVNEETVLVTTSWDATVVGPWQGNLDRFPHELRVHLWTGQTWTGFDPRPHSR